MGGDADPVHLVWTVNKIDGYHAANSRRSDPAHLVWVVNQIVGQRAPTGLSVNLLHRLDKPGGVERVVVRLPL